MGHKPPAYPHRHFLERNLGSEPIALQLPPAVSLLQLAQGFSVFCPRRAPSLLGLTEEGFFEGYIFLIVGPLRPRAPIPPYKFTKEIFGFFSTILAQNINPRLYNPCPLVTVVLSLPLGRQLS